MVTTLVSCPTAFDLIVTVLVNGPSLFVSYFTPIVPFAPGAISPSGLVGTVQPHEP